MNPIDSAKAAGAKLVDDAEAEFGKVKGTVWGWFVANSRKIALLATAGCVVVLAVALFG